MIEVKADWGRNRIKSPLNRRKAIRLMCVDCSGYERSKVLNCQYTDCLLYQFRMGIGNQNPVHRNKSIKLFCTWCMADQPSEIAKCTSEDCPLFKFRGYLSKKHYQEHSSVQRCSTLS